MIILHSIVNFWHGLLAALGLLIGMAADTLRNQAQDVMPGFGGAGNDGGSSVNVGGTFTGLSTATAQATPASLGTANKGYIRIGASAPTSAGVYSSIIVTVTDGTTTAVVYAATFPTLAAGGLSILIPWESDLAVNSASVTLAFSGGGTATVSIELCGNIGQPASGTSQL